MKEQLINLINDHVEKLENIDSYYGSVGYETNLYLILGIVEQLGYDLESDEEYSDYCLKATDIEQMRYLLTHVLLK